MKRDDQITIVAAVLAAQGTETTDAIKQARESVKAVRKELQSDPRIGFTPPKKRKRSKS